MIEVMYFANKNLPSIRLITALSLYFDKIVMPLAHLPEQQSPFVDVLKTFPKGEQIFFGANASFVRRYKVLSPTIFEFTNPLEKLGEDTSNYSTLADMLKKSPYNEPRIFPLTQIAYTLGRYDAASEVNEERNLSRITIPFSNSKNVALESSLAPNLKDKRLADVLASWLAIESISLALPDLEAVDPSEILWAREELAEELTTFRMAMYRLAKELRGLLKDNVSAENISVEATFLAKTTIQPAVQILREKLKLERKSFARKLVIRTLDTFKIVVNYCVSPDPVKITQLASATAMGILDFSQYCDELTKLKNEAALSYLAKLPDQFSK